ncbi:DeoR/GlpR family DNA-binding transcription regulator [Gemmobacter serpentinus]|uniref:DeoR/GlpR family DNA-binding transcription regulator n=1 Tax=Gemmobacter serpentinus TaxID=2652247 RepID=UPI00186577D9|nr:DeoR/GlpR family DNA-binding transcription regulator [Gemmobacter serpentinus]
MLTQDRKAMLMDRLSRDGRLIAADLATELQVSEDTIRRDLRDLAAEGRLLRVHGGALPLSPTHAPVAVRRSLHPRAKAALAQAAVSLIQPGQIVLMDGGTTHLALVSRLPPGLACTIVTHAPAIAAALEPFPGIEILLVGGPVLRLSMVATGAQAFETYAGIRADLCFLGVTGLHPETGLTTGHPEEARLKARMIQSAAETVVLATPDKLGATSPYRVAGLGGMTSLVSSGPPPDWLPEGCRHIAA